MGNAPSAPVNMDTVRNIVEDLRDAKPMVYFADLLLCTVIGWGLFALALGGRKIASTSFFEKKEAKKLC